MGNARQIKILSDVNGQFVYYSMFSIPTYIDQNQVILSVVMEFFSLAGLHYNMNFVKNHFGKMNLWPVEHLFAHIYHHF